MEVTLGAVGSGMKEQAHRRGGYKTPRNRSQLVGTDGVMTLELVVVARKRAPRR